MQLFLASSFAQVLPLFARFMPSGVQGKTVAFIATASLHESYTAYVDEARQAWRAIGAQLLELDVCTSSSADLAEQLASCDLIYISGGNTFFLLQELRRSGAGAVIASLVQAGMPYVGESAGAAVVSPDVAYMAHLDERNAAPLLADTKALGLVPFYPLPHWGNAPFKEAGEAVVQAHQGPLPLQPFSNHQAIEVQGKSTQVTSVVL